MAYLAAANEVWPFVLTQALMAGTTGETPPGRASKGV
jgi:hypothetical protein